MVRGTPANQHQGFESQVGYVEASTLCVQVTLSSRGARALIQSTLDGFNVTIMAYGQTGSGKTYTMIGSENNPGIAPRAFKRLFQLIEAGHSRHTVQASAYMMELYNDKLIDLLRPTGNNELTKSKSESEYSKEIRKEGAYAMSFSLIHPLVFQSEKLDIKKDKKGSVHVQGATVCSVSSAGELMRAFQQGLTNRHTAATKMNVESSRSHLIIVVCLTITSRQTGSVLKGKLTLVDLAGSERVSKSGASADQLREANSINKSLSALGDVVSALSSESSFVPYRNSKLTMLLQDSLGGNSKTLVFVNVSPVAHNADETLVSLMYASRIKQITNSVSRNSDNKEISRLKSIISKLKKGEDLDEDIT
ncbi:Kinesin-like calmodulin-binding protein [Portunus trituberculatus]|uniref:Kinesin-like protein n=1 Tax=Portunus trituberculatus TaxID=210409 RepID=A0A5B7EVV6_PORTR|nr:Kinesin-like calmodulin-binding protein [Portunus trituberculatus]